MSVLIGSRSLKVHRMNSIFFYVILGAIGLTKCHLNFNLTELSRQWYHNQVFQDQWKIQSNGKNNQTSKKWAEIPEDIQFVNSSEEKVSKAEINKEENNTFRVYLNKMYDECSKKGNKRVTLLRGNGSVSPAEGPLEELKGYLSAWYGCVKVSSFRYLDGILEADFIPLTDYVYFVKNENLNRSKEQNSFKEYETEILSKNWRVLLSKRLRNLLRDYSLKYEERKDSTNEGRSRRRDHRMFAMMVMGFMIMASILIPMGFQFLTVLGGKSLLMAKMALIMSAINGLKKIATSNVGYGFYHTGSDGHHHDHIHHGFHEKLFHANPQGSSSQYAFN